MIDFNKENSAFKSRRMVKTISGAIKTVDEMKEEYYNVKRFNVELLVDNQELGRLNNELNADALRRQKELAELREELNARRAADEADNSQLVEARQNNEELLQQNKKLLEDSKGMTDFMLMNFLKVGEDLKDSRDELGFVKRELAIEIQLLRRLVLKKLVPRLEEANSNCTLLCAVNDAYEKEKSEVSLKVNMILRLCEGGASKALVEIKRFCNEIFEIQDQTKSQDSDLEQDYKSPSVASELPGSQVSGGTKGSGSQKAFTQSGQMKSEMMLTVPSKDYNKLIYSELSLEQAAKLPRQKPVSVKASAERKLVKAEGPGLAEKSKETNESVTKYQINYAKSYTGRSSSAESEEFNNGMDVLLKEYMTDKIKKKTSAVSEQIPRPPYNTQANKEVDLEEYILRTKPPEETDSETREGAGEGKLPFPDKKLHMSLNTEDRAPEQEDPGDLSQSLSRNWPTSKNNEIEDANLDRESGFEDIVEKLIGIMCLEDQELRTTVCSIYNRMFEKNEMQSMGTNEDMLRSLKDSSNFKNKMIECLSENEKQEVARQALEIFKKRLSASDTFAGLSLKPQNYNSHKKRSRGNDSQGDMLARMDRLEKENNILVGELEKNNKAEKATAVELEAARAALDESQRKVEELSEEVAILTQRLELFERENQTEVSEYNDEYFQGDPANHRLSNNMLIIQEADEEYEIESALSGQELQDQAQKLLLQRFEPKTENASIDNESHYSFFRDPGKSDEEADFDSEKVRSFPEIRAVPKRRATESSRRPSREQLSRYIEEMAAGPTRTKKRRTLGNVGVAVARRRLEKSESDNLSAPKPATFEFDGVRLKMNRTLEEPTSKSSDFKKIGLKRLITDPVSKSLANHERVGESPRQLQSEAKGTSAGGSGQQTPEQMVSFLSQERSANARFNFSKNFEEDARKRRWTDQ